MSNATTTTLPYWKSQARTLVMHAAPLILIEEANKGVRISGIRWLPY